MKLQAHSKLLTLGLCRFSWELETTKYEKLHEVPVIHTTTVQSGKQLAPLTNPAISEIFLQRNR